MQSNTNTKRKKGCNCRNKDNYPLDGKFLIKCIVYEATVPTTNQTNTYFGSTVGNFKRRYKYCFVQKDTYIIVSFKRI